MIARRLTSANHFDTGVCSHPVAQFSWFLDIPNGEVGSVSYFEHADLFRKTKRTCGVPCHTQ
jgi:hypothetical protein